MTLDSGRDSHGRGHKMCPATSPLPPFEVPVAGRCATLPRLKHISIHGKAHAAAGFPPLKTRFFENSIEAFLFSLLLDQSRSWHHQRMHPLGHMFAFRQTRCQAEILDA
jgi:hypothetical protein